MTNREAEAFRNLRPLTLLQLEERLEVSTLAGGSVGLDVWDGGLVVCCHSEKCDEHIVPWVMEDPAPDESWL